MSSRDRNPKENGANHMMTNQELAPEAAIDCLGGRIPIQGTLVGKH